MVNPSGPGGRSISDRQGTPIGTGGQRAAIGQGQQRGPAINQPQRPGPPVQPRPTPVQVQPQQVHAQQVHAQQVHAQQVHAQQMHAQQQAQQRAQVAPAQPQGSVTGGLKPGMANPNDPNLKPLERLFALMAQYDSSDLHLKAGCPPVMRVRGEMRPLQLGRLSSDDIYEMLKTITTAEQIKSYDETGDLDFAFMLPDQARSRFRLNVFRDKRANALVARRINNDIPSFEDLNLPGESLRKIMEAEDGLIVLAGVTGSGKSTTIASMIDWINENHAKHIVTVEDPIEFEFTNKRSFISQREIGVDCVDFKAAIRTLVRQDPDVILIGEMRDQETFEFGLTAAETGHLVFGTLHAGTVSQSIGRILGLFPPDKHHVLRQGLQFNLRSIICQKLVPSPVRGRQPINEILIASPIVKKILAEGADKKLNAVMMGGREDGMMTFDQCLLGHCKAGVIEVDMALKYATNPDQFKLRVQGIELGGSSGGIIG
ncbi:MAG: PilT/PilU family type 4a pilus ATPase [Planctomycetes bacterium]|nr:PilT/PilU family type 4a pilus ATPase [Planctomycetota bacterium]